MVQLSSCLFNSFSKETSANISPEPFQYELYLARPSFIQLTFPWPRSLTFYIVTLGFDNSHSAFTQADFAKYIA